MVRCVLFPSEFDRALARAAFLFRKASHNRVGGGRLGGDSRWRGSRRSFDRCGTTVREYRRRRRVSPPSLCFDDNGLGTAVTKALLDDA